MQFETLRVKKFNRTTWECLLTSIIHIFLKKFLSDTSSVENIHSMLLLMTPTLFLQLVWTCKEDSTRKSWKSLSRNRARHYTSSHIVLISNNIKPLRRIQLHGKLAPIHRDPMSSRTSCSRIMARCFHLTSREARNGNLKFVTTSMTKYLVASIFMLFWEAKNLYWDFKNPKGFAKVFFTNFDYVVQKIFRCYLLVQVRMRKSILSVWCWWEYWRIYRLKSAQYKISKSL